MEEIFPVIIMNARPAAGKSEVIEALRSVPEGERASRFHIGPLKIFDDFPMLWTWFEEDDLLDRVFGRPRLHTTEDGYFIHEDLWHLLIRRLDLEYHKWRRDAEGRHTAVIEFSRGAAHGGYAQAYQQLSDEILRKACAVYIQVSYQESLRKNQARFNPERPDSILEHGLSAEKMERLYRDDDWESFSAADPRFLQVRGHRVPYVIFENEDDVTSAGGTALLDRLEDSFGRLWERYQARQA